MTLSSSEPLPLGPWARLHQPDATRWRTRNPRTFQNELVRIARLSTASTPIEGYRFENCEIVGPAIFSEFSDVVAFSCTLEESCVVVDLPDVMMGTLALRRCEFVHCSFADLGFALPPTQANAILGELARRSDY